MKNKERVLNYLKDHEGEFLDAQIVADYLSMKRNAASSILNELEREHILHKKKTRPALFEYGQNKANTVLKDTQQKEEGDPFVGFVGYNGSLKGEIEKCKISATYPGRGLPIMLLGESGVGKSMLARYIYQYSVYMGVIKKNAPYIVLNCADYSNNKELLAATLFGYKKGAFTGAEKDTIGLIEQSDSGYLFLDEIHRLSEEGQEKLFRYLDYGVFSRVGAAGEERKVNVRFIFATTEDPEQVMIDTFIRRIPMFVRIKSFSERSLSERMNLVKKLFFQEAHELSCNLKIQNSLIEYLVNIKEKGNVGALRNRIKILCATVYSRERKGVLTIRRNDIESSPIILKNTNDLKYDGYTIIDINNELVLLEDQAYKSITNMIDLEEVYSVTEEFKLGKINFSKWEQYMSDTMSQLAGNFYRENIYDENEAIINKYIEQTAKFISMQYGLSLEKAHVEFLKSLVICFNREIKEDCEKDKKLLKTIMSIIPTSYRMEQRFAEYLLQNTFLSVDSSLEKVLISVYLQLSMKMSRSMPRAIIIMHGHGVASGMAGLANYVYGEYIFDFIDVDMDTRYQDVCDQVKIYLKESSTSQGVLLLVDMGALRDLHIDVKNLVEGDLAVVDNISNQMLIGIGEQLIKGETIKKIVDEVQCFDNSKALYIEKSEKPWTILTCCISGLGTSAKIAKMIDDCMKNRDKIVVKPCEYAELRNQGNKSSVFSNYNVLFIISTTELEIQNVPVLLLNELVEDKGQKIICNSFTKIFSKSEIKSFMNEMVKSFSLKNIISQLSILNPEKIIEDVDKQIGLMETLLQREIPLDIKKMLLIHISIMIERLMTEPNFVSEEIDTKFQKSHQKFVSLVEKSFSVIEKKYNTIITIKEIRLLYNIFSYRGWILED